MRRLGLAATPPKRQLRQSDPPDIQNPPQGLGYLPVTGGSLPRGGLGSIHIQWHLG